MSNRMAGKLGGRGVEAFDYSYTTGSGKDRHTTTLSVVLVASEIELKSLVIRPESFFDKLAEFLGWDEIKFESAEFSRRFHVKSPDRKWAYDVIDQRMMDFLLQSNTRLHIQFCGECIVLWGGGTFDVAMFERALSVGCGMLDRLPAYVVKEQTETT